MTIDCVDVERVAGFWSALLGRRPRRVCRSSTREKHAPSVAGATPTTGVGPAAWAKEGGSTTLVS
ncbi:VOC family protein [Streptomyces sp. NPDC050355]|uniref:VOC family protein n=1 Tax=Streptomyces sp. NPDC050355 TaxID=3365609 RepID=UPI00379B25E0